MQLNETTNYHELIEQLTQSYPKLSPQLQKTAAYILEHPGNVATLSMRKIAANAGVPPPTLPRLAQSLGFDTYESFRDVYRHKLQNQNKGYSEQAGLLQRYQQKKDLAPLMSAFEKANMDNIGYLFSSIDPDEIDRISDIILAARNVYIIGMQASYAVAEYLHYVGRMAFPNWQLISNRNADMAEQLLSLNSEDAIIVIASEPCARESIICAQYAKDKKATVIGITNSRITPLAARSTHVLTVPMKSPQYFDSFVTKFALVELLVGTVVAKGEQNVVLNIAEIEQCRNDLGEYWHDNKG